MSFTMCRMIRIWANCLCVVLMLSAAVSAATEDFIVTAVSPPDSATIHLGDKLSPGEEGQPTTISVADGGEIMFYDSSPNVELVGIVLGPATFIVAQSDGKTIIEPQQGEFLFSSNSDAQVSYLRVPSSAEKPLLEMLFPQGELFLTRQGPNVQLKWSPTGTAAEPLEAQYLDKEEKLKIEPGKAFSISEDGLQDAPTGAWVASATSAIYVGTLGRASLAVETPRVQEQLFQDILTWDKGAKPEAAIKKLLGEGLRYPEIRVVTQNVSTPQTPTTANQQLAGNPGFPGANQVSSLSPAAVSVSGVTAIDQVNSQAAFNLTNTGSQGLGFGGLRLLALPSSGFFGRPLPNPGGVGAGARLIPRR